MSTFIACVKKEFKETWRAKRLFIFGLIALGMMIFSFVSIFTLEILNEIDLIADILGEFQLSYSMSTMFFMSFISSYFIIISIILLRDVFSKEINEKKWVLPMQAGIKPSTIIFARLLVVTLTVVVSVFAACLLHFILTLIVCSPEVDTVNAVAAPVGTQITDMLYVYGMAIVAIGFFTTVVCALNAIIKKMGWTIFISIFIYIVLPKLFFYIPVGNSALGNFTPFLFLQEMLQVNTMTNMVGMGGPSSSSIGWLEWLIASLSTVLITAGLIVWSVSANKIKSEKN